MQKPTLIINGQDLSAYVDYRGYSVEYELREGGNGGMMLDGSLTVDVLARKMVCHFALNAIRSTALQAIQLLVQQDYVSATVFDPRINTTYTAQFIPTIDTQSLAFIREGVLWFREGTVITLRER